MRILFPTFTGIWKGSFGLGLSPWLSTPWWKADTLASKQHSLLRMLAVAAEQRLEVAPLVACMSAEHRFRFRRRLRRLAQRLAAGTSLADALEQTPGALSDEQSLAVRFGDQSGTLPATFKQLLEPRNQAAAQTAAHVRRFLRYPVIIMGFFTFILAFLCIKIIPSFNAILDDFALEPPRALNALTYWSELAANYWFVIFLVIIALVWLFRSETSRRFFRRQVLSRIMPPVAQLRSADLLDLLAVTVNTGRPMSGALSTLARYHFDSFIRGKLLFVRNEVEQGADVWKSMATAKLLTPAEARALESSTSPQSRAWSMRQLAQLKRSAVARRINMYVSLFEPLTVLLLGLLVLFVAVACMSPFFNLISGLAY